MRLPWTRRQQPDNPKAAAPKPVPSRLSALRVAMMWPKQGISHPGETANDLTYSWRIPRLFASYNHIATSAMQVPLSLREVKPARRGPQQKFAMVSTNAIARAKHVVPLFTDTAAAQYLKQRDMEMEDVDDGHPLRVLLDKVNAGRTWSEHIYMTMFDLEAAGNAYWELVGGKGGAMPTGLYRIRPDIIKARPNGEWEVKQNGQEVIMDAGEVLHFRYPHPTNDFYGLSRAEVLEWVVQTEWDRLQFVRNFLKNGGQLGGLLTPIDSSVDTFDPDTATAIYQQWIEEHWGVDKLTNVSLGGLLDFKEIGRDPKQAGTLEFATRNDAEIGSVTGVSPSTFDARMTNRASYETAKAQFWEETMSPKLKLVAGVVTEFLCPRYGEGLIAEFDFKGIAALQEPNETKVARREKLFLAGACEVNELRAAEGLDPWEDDRGRQRFIPATGQLATPEEEGTLKAERKQREEQARVDAAARLQQARQLAEAGNGNGKPNVQDETGKAVAPVVVKAPFASKQHQRFSEQWEARLTAAEDLLQGRIADWAVDLGDKVASKVGKASGKAVAPSVKVLFDAKTQGEELWRIVLGAGYEIARDEAGQVLRELDLARLAFDVNNEAVREHFREAELFVKSIPANLHDKLRGLLDDAAREGWPIADLQRAIADRFDIVAGTQSRAIAQTEMVGAMNVTRASAIAEAGLGREWIATLDDRVRDTHAANHGLVRYGEDTFPNGLKYPGQSGAPAAERINCRCAIAAVASEEAE